MSAKNCQLGAARTLFPALSLLIASVMVTACAPEKEASPPAAAVVEQRQSRPGSDRDEHGCIGSAGYVWCARTGQCERPWELAAQQDFENSGEAFAAYCSEG